MRNRSEQAQLALAMRYWPILLAALAATQLPACGEAVDDQQQNLADMGGCELADPICHHIATSACVSDDDCPSGTICDPLPTQDFSAQWPTFDGTGLDAECVGARGKAGPLRSCQLPRGRSRLEVLPDQLHVGTFDIEQVHDGQASAASFQWRAPSGTRLVACALFGCAPVVAKSGEFEGEPLYAITNYSRCALAATHSADAQGVFDLADPSNEVSAPESECAASTADRFVAELSVGCWAFDATRIIAATALKPVDPRIVYDYQDYRVADCSSPEATSSRRGRQCVREDGALGLCSDHSCRKPCVSSADCGAPIVAEQDDLNIGGAQSIDDPVGGASPASEPTIVCVKSGAYVGVCSERGGGS